MPNAGPQQECTPVIRVIRENPSAARGFAGAPKNRQRILSVHRGGWSWNAGPQQWYCTAEADRHEQEHEQEQDKHAQHVRGENIRTKATRFIYSSQAAYPCGDGLGLSGAGCEDDVRCGIRASGPVQHPSGPRVRGTIWLSPRACRQVCRPLLRFAASLARRASLELLPREALPPPARPRRLGSRGALRGPCRRRRRPWLSLIHI